MSAREQIIRAANKHRSNRMLQHKQRVGFFEFAPKKFTMRHLNECVCICRRRGLVSADILVAAGFRP